MASLDNALGLLEIFTKRQRFNNGTLSRLLNLWLSPSGQYSLSPSLRVRILDLDTIRTHSTYIRHLKMTVVALDCIFLPDDAHLPLLEKTFEILTEDGLKPVSIHSLANVFSGQSYWGHCDGGRRNIYILPLYCLNFSHWALVLEMVIQVHCLMPSQAKGPAPHCQFPFLLAPTIRGVPATFGMPA